MAGATREATVAVNGKEANDPKKPAQAFITLANADTPPLHLQCFEDRIAVTCPAQGMAEIHYQMTQDGVRDAGKIQAVVDARWAPKG